MEESDSRLSWYILGFAILALGWGIWLKVNEKGEETGSGEEREWIRLPGGKLVDKHSEEPFEGVRELPFELDPTMIEWEYTYVGGLRHGPAVEYFPGIGKRVKSRSNYLEGTLNGTVTTYYEKGGVASKCEAVDGWLTGLMTFYDRDGRVTQRQVYELSAPTSQAAIIEDPPLTIEEIEEANLDNTDRILNLFKEWQIIEAKELYKISRIRIETIKKFEAHINNNSREVPEIHNFFKKFPWILDPRIMNFKDEVTYSKLLKENFKDGDVEENKRIDFLCLNFSESHFIIELKKSLMK